MIRLRSSSFGGRVRSPLARKRDCGCTMTRAIIDGAAMRMTEIYGDCDRVDREMWAWLLTDSQPFTPPLQMRGVQGFWMWPK